MASRIVSTSEPIQSFTRPFLSHVLDLGFMRKDHETFAHYSPEGVADFARSASACLGCFWYFSDLDILEIFQIQLHIVIILPVSLKKLSFGLALMTTPCSSCTTIFGVFNPTPFGISLTPSHFLLLCSRTSTQLISTAIYSSTTLTLHLVTWLRSLFPLT